VIPTARSSFAAFAVALTATIGCRSVPAPAADLLPLGPGPQMQLGIRGIANVSPSIATREPFVAIAWAAGVLNGRGAVYLVTSTDNGATFSAPARVGETTLDRDNAPVVVFEWPVADERQRLAMPDIRVEWTFQDRDRLVPRTAHSSDGGRTLVRDPDDRVHLYYTGGPDLSSLPIDRVVGTDATRRSVAHPHVTRLDDGTVASVWDEEASRDARRVEFRRVLLGANGPTQVIDTFPLSASEPAVAPAMGLLPGGVIVAWTSGRSSSSSIAVRRVGLDTLCAEPSIRLVYEPNGHAGHD
jgi:hypothetical protein